MADPLPPDEPTPRWVKVAGIVGIAVIALILLALVTGRHDGRGRHGSATGTAEVLTRL